MKITQDLIVFDLEATTSQSPEGFQENKNIIQIGAVYLKRLDGKKYEIADRFNQLVKPTDELISSFITELTGITNEAVQGAPEFAEAGEVFSSWAEKNGSLKQVRLCAWGTYFDVPLLRAMYQRHRKSFPFSGTAYDVKTWAALWMMLSGRKSDKANVKSVADVMGIEAPGRLHDASVDAELTALIALGVFSDLDHGFFLDQRNGPATHCRVSV